MCFGIFLSEGLVRKFSKSSQKGITQIIQQHKLKTLMSITYDAQLQNPSHFLLGNRNFKQA